MKITKTIEFTVEEYSLIESCLNRELQSCEEVNDYCKGEYNNKISFIKNLLAKIDNTSSNLEVLYD